MKKLGILFLLTVTSIGGFGQDIVVKGMIYNTDQFQYQQFNAHVIIQNIGNDSVNAFNVTSIYFSKDSIFDEHDKYGASSSFRKLAPNELDTIDVYGSANQFGLNVDSSYNYVIAYADSRNEIDEENEVNNTWFGEVNISNTDIDLAVGDNLVTPDGTFRHGEILQVQMTLQSISEYHLHHMTYQYYLSRGC